MSLKEREGNRVRPNVVSSIISNEADTSNNTVKEDTGKLKAKSYYLTGELYKAVNLRAAVDGVDKSKIVRDAIATYLKDTLEELKK